ncbi:MAG: hypothetical protein PUH11_07520 [Bacilli bacterium]|nr:hypothetical protein [Bacilli bacterium]
MKYLTELTKRKIFNYQDFVTIVGDSNLAKNTLQNYLEKGYIKRIKHNLYGVVSLETNECIVNKFLIASNITDTSFVSHHSAFEFYGYYNQVYYNVNVSSISKFNTFEFEENNYTLIKTSSTDFVDTIRGVKVTSIERTIVDCIKDSGKYCDLEETLNCINLLPYISAKDILKYLELINSKILYKKVGIILSLFKDKLNIPNSFFEKCHEISDSIKGHFDKNKNAHVYNSEWKIFIYKDLKNYINKE